MLFFLCSSEGAFTVACGVFFLFVLPRDIKTCRYLDAEQKLVVAKALAAEGFANEADVSPKDLMKLHSNNRQLINNSCYHAGKILLGRCRSRSQSSSGLVHDPYFLPRGRNAVCHCLFRTQYVLNIGRRPVKPANL